MASDTKKIKETLKESSSTKKWTSELEQYLSLKITDEQKMETKNLFHLCLGLRLLAKTEAKFTHLNSKKVD